MALNDRNASAKVSAFVFPKVAGTVGRIPSFVPEAVPVAGLNNPAHSFGVAQAFGGGPALGSSVNGPSEAVT